MNDEEVAFRVVRLYFEEVARLGFKRQLDMDQIINAYFYTLKKIKDKDVAMRKIIREIEAKERAAKEKFETKTVTTTTTANVPVVKEVTTTTVTSDKPLGKSITDIIEER